jgi:thiopurine S-methyltransferase
MKKKNETHLDKAYWEKRYSNTQIGWDIGYPSTPIKTYIDQLEDKSLRILIPGAGNCYEAEYLWNKGFKNVYVLDFAKQPLDHLNDRIANFPQAQLLHMNFFDLNNHFDLILEHTFFCALNPSLRQRYVDKMSCLLQSNGKLVGLLFDFELTESGPPYGGSLPEYISLFEELFKIKILEPSINSIKERQGKELFFIFEKKT